MVSSNKFLAYLSFCFGTVGIILCVAGFIGVWSVYSRLTQATETVFVIINESVVAVQNQIVKTQRCVQESKITTKDIEESLKNRTRNATNERLVSRLEIEKNANQLILGLQQADQWMELSGASIQAIQQTLKIENLIGIPVDDEFAIPLLEKLELLQHQMKKSTEFAEGIRDRAAMINKVDTREDRIRQAIQLTLRVVATLGEIDSRLGESIEIFSELQARVQFQKEKTHRWIMFRTICANLIIIWVGAGQISLTFNGWKGFTKDNQQTAQLDVFSTTDDESHLSLS